MSEPAPTTTSLRNPCPRCGALVGSDDRFCSVCGTAAPAARPAQAARRRGLWLLLGSAGCLLLIFAAVAWIYYSSPERRAERPVSRLPSGVPNALTILPGNPPMALVASGGKPLVSPDRGATWQPLAFDGVIAAAAGSSTVPAMAYLAGDHVWQGNARGFQAVDNDLPTGPVRALVVDPTDSQRVYALAPGRGLYRSDDGGRHWVLQGADLPADATSLAMAGPGTFFLGTAEHGVFASADGRTWSNASGFVNGALPTRVVTSIAFDPASGDRYVAPSGQTLTGAVYVGTDQGVFKSIDGGLSWAALPLHQPILALAVVRSGPRLMLAVDAGGQVFRSENGGNSW